MDRVETALLYERSPSIRAAMSQELCKSCGACCLAGAKLQLSAPEYDGMVAAGSLLRRLEDEPLPIKGKRDTAFYALESDCARLDPTTRQCTAYADRPQACHDLEAGALICLNFRERAGIVDLPMPRLRMPAGLVAPAPTPNVVPLIPDAQPLAAEVPPAMPA